MADLTIRDRLPLELCLEAVIHQDVRNDAVVTRDQLAAGVMGALRAADHAEAVSYFDQTLTMLVSRGLLKRHHLGPGQLGYEPTAAWENKEAVLSDVLPPKRKFRPARNARRRAETLARREERETTIAQRQAEASERLRALLSTR